MLGDRMATMAAWTRLRRPARLSANCEYVGMDLEVMQFFVGGFEHTGYLHRVPGEARLQHCSCLMARDDLPPVVAAGLVVEYLAYSLEMIDHVAAPA